MPQPYKPWDFCKYINCNSLIRSEEQRDILCTDCKAFQMHHYLSERGQIYEINEPRLTSLEIMKRYEGTTQGAR